MSKKMIKLTVVMTLAIFFICALLSSEDASQKVQAVFPKIAAAIYVDSFPLKQEEVLTSMESTKVLTESEQLQEKLGVLAKELKAIDFAREVNDPNTSETRREEIVKKMNLYASLVGQYSQIEIKKFKSGGNQ